MEHSWLYHYPQPNTCIHDQGPEFNNHVFQFKLIKWGIELHLILVKNLQANSICEQLHQMIANLISVFVHTHPPQTVLEAQRLIEDAITSTSHAYRSTIHITLGTSPRAIVFNCDMFLDIPYIADLIMLQNK